MVIRLLDPRVDAMIDMVQPVNLLYPLKPTHWWLALPGTTGGRRIMDVMNLGPNDNHGVLNASMNPASAWVASNRPGGWGALDLDGDGDFIDFGDVPGSDTGSKLTVCFSVKPRTLAAMDGFLVKWNDAGGVSGNTWGVRITNADTAEIFVFIAEASDGGNNYFTTSDLNLVTNVWVTIWFVYDGALSASERLKVYADAGRAVSGSITGTIPTSLNPSTNPVAFRRLAAGLPYPDTFVDDICIFPRALTQRELAETHRLSERGYPGLLNRIDRRVFAEEVAVGGRTMGALAGHGGLAGPGGIAGRRGGLAA